MMNSEQKAASQEIKYTLFRKLQICILQSELFSDHGELYKPVSLHTLTLSINIPRCNDEF